MRTATGAASGFLAMEETVVMKETRRAALTRRARSLVLRPQVRHEAKARDGGAIVKPLVGKRQFLRARLNIGNVGAVCAYASD